MPCNIKDDKVLCAHVGLTCSQLVHKKSKMQLIKCRSNVTKIAVTFEK